MKREKQKLNKAVDNDEKGAKIVSTIKVVSDAFRNFERIIKTVEASQGTETPVR